VVGDKDVWAYDKRFHISMEESLKVPYIEPPPEFQPGWKMIEGGWVVVRLGLKGCAAMRWDASRWTAAVFSSRQLARIGEVEGAGLSAASILPPMQASP
jgi:hypothetical protein